VPGTPVVVVPAAVVVGAVSLSDVHDAAIVAAARPSATRRRTAADFPDDLPDDLPDELPDAFDRACITPSFQLAPHSVARRLWFDVAGEPFGSRARHRPLADRCGSTRFVEFGP